MFQRQKISSSPFSICFLKIYKNPSDNCYIFSGAHKSKQNQVHYSWIIKQTSQCRNFRKTNVVEKDQENLFFNISFLLSSHIFFSFDIFNSGYLPKCILQVWSLAKFISSKVFDTAHPQKQTPATKWRKWSFSKQSER